MDLTALRPTALRRFPDVEGPGLTAVDAADRLLLDEAAAAIAATPDGALAVIDDAYGALTLGAAELGARDIRVHQNLLTGERALSANAERLGTTGVFTARPLDSGLLAGATTVLLRLPRSLDRLAELAALIAAHADPGVRVFAGGRIKHMSVAMNDVLRAVFERVDVTHARQKSRVLIASGAKTLDAAASAGQWPRTEFHADLGLTVVAHGGVFAGTRIDIGTRFLLEQFDALPAAPTAVDLACGSGIVAAALAARRPDVRVVATDRSAAAVASARATAAANGVGERVDVVRADGLETLPEASQELVLLNPPFHSDASLSTGIAEHLFADAGRALAPGGELWCVWNSHLRYRPALDRLVGPTRQIARNPKFTVTASTRRAR
ncbi:methyltransferase [Gordonia sp. PP30]|uniref:class I SAM-dependent methyltransferase n=1 Tax=Gordonia sp. PP30 TaxID=2935861 RepID=UPI001FFE9595|nr:methyltransferase [Gordonia sp. PP30]UQE75570.1 methyltransferase [Gordonia sp. PP30]